MKLKLLSAIFSLAFIPFVNGAAAAEGTDDGDEAAGHRSGVVEDVKHDDEPITDTFQRLMTTARDEDCVYREEVKEFFGRRKEKLLLRLEALNSLQKRCENTLEKITKGENPKHEKAVEELLRGALPHGDKLRLLQVLELENMADQAKKVEEAIKATEAVDKIKDMIQAELARIPV